MTDKEPLKQIEVQIAPLDPADIEKFNSILRQHVRDRKTGLILDDEIEEIKGFMAGKLDKDRGAVRNYLVAKDITGRVVGCMAYSVPDKDMLKHFDTTSDESAELLNAFVTDEVFRGGGVGRQLLNAVCEEVRDQGKKKLIINSGPRYKASWGFYDKVCDKNKGFILDKYDKGGHANTWVKYLNEPSKAPVEA